MRFFLSFPLLFFLSTLLTLDLIAQNSSVSIKIINDSKEVLPFANIVNLSTKNGFTSNFNGEAIVSFEKNSDTIQISYIGYSIAYYKIIDLQKDSLVVLKARIQEIPEVRVNEKSDYLYNLLLSCKKSKTYKLDTAKTYFLLNTTQNSKLIERIESYYNGVYESYDLKSLHYKKGRAFIDSIKENRYFRSLNTSKLIGLIETFNNSPYFPTQPLELNKKELKKRYILEYRSSFLNDKGQKVYKIEAIPKKGGFNAILLVNIDRTYIEKITLNYTDASNSPFLPIWETDKLENIDFEIEKTFTQKDGHVYPTSIHFYYDLNYVNREKENYNLRSEAVLYPYDYNNSFNLPNFYFVDSYSDYSKIVGIPYDTNFWAYNKEFTLSNKDETEIYNWMKSPKKLEFGRLHESEYRIWKGGNKRILFRNVEQYVGGINNNPTSNESYINSDLYNLEVQWYYDYNIIEDSIFFQSYSVFDPFQSFFKFELDNAALAYINMYFDVHEIYRRELQSEINYKDKLDSQINRLQKTLTKRIKVFNKEVERGNNLVNMKSWNILINSELGIDNMSIFGLGNEK